jgi:hypothetical protein
MWLIRAEGEMKAMVAPGSRAFGFMGEGILKFLVGLISSL